MAAVTGPLVAVHGDATQFSENSELDVALIRRVEGEWDTPPQLTDDS